LAVAWRELDVFVEAERGKRGVQILRADVRVEQREHVGIADASCAGNEVAPRPLTKLEILHLVEFREPWCDAGLNWPLTKQAGAKRVNRTGEKPLEIR
jgi:hypothetical protein